MIKQLSKIFVILAVVMFVCACGGGGGGGDEGGSTSVTAAKIDLLTDNYQLGTGSTDVANITVIARDSSNRAVSGAVIDFSATAGTIGPGQVTTDSTGTASAQLNTAPEKANQVLTVTAQSGSLYKSLPITLYGTSLSLTTVKNSLLVGGDTSELTVRAVDSKGNAIPFVPVNLTSVMGNKLSTGSVEKSSVTVTTNKDGYGKVTLISPASPGVDTILAEGQGAQASLNINITSAKFSFTVPTENATIAAGASTQLVVTWNDASGHPVANQTVNFLTTAGYFDNVIGKSATAALTNSFGQAVVTYSAAVFSSPADITATAGSETANLRLMIAALDPNQLVLQAFPTVIGPSIGSSTPTSIITATVRNAAGQLISGETVLFTLVSGPGGGETLSSGYAVTDAAGKASVNFISGNAVSAQNGVSIRATLQSVPSVYFDTSLTIAQTATSIVLGSTNKIEKVTVSGQEVAYAYPFSALVVDSNGNPVAGATVNLGIYPLYFYTGYRNNDDAVYTHKFRNEDVNRNGFLDTGEDGARGWTDPTALFTSPTNLVWYSGHEGTVADVSSGLPNGRLDPGGAVAIPASVTTDENGLAAFQVTYAKSFGNWIDVEITASTSVNGSNSSSMLETNLPVAANDQPYSSSPFGY